jgi:ankyrin repeat protein
MDGRALVFSAPLGAAQDLKTAIERGDEVAVRRFATVDNVNAEDPEDRMTPLMRAVSCQRKDMARLLIELGADVNVQTSGQTALCVALRGQFCSMARLLLQHGASVDSHIVYNALTALMVATTIGNRELVRLVIEAGANVNELVDGRTPLIVALVCRHDNMIAQLCEAGADVNKAISDGRFTALQIAIAVARPNDDAIIRQLLACGANPNQFNSHAFTALHMAVERDKARAVALLVAYGADPNLKQQGGESALDLALRIFGRHHAVTGALIAPPTMRL